LSGQNGQATRDRTDDREGERLWMLGAVLTRATSGYLRRGRSWGWRVEWGDCIDFNNIVSFSNSVSDFCVGVCMADNR